MRIVHNTFEAGATSVPATNEDLLMKTISKALAKTSVATVAAGALAMTSAAPAFARDRGHDNIDAGDVIAGAVILGGIAAILSSGKRDRYHHSDRNYRYGDRYDTRRGNGRAAIERCVRAVERDARRAGYRFANVTEIRDVDRERYGWEVKGRLVVDGARGYGYRGDRYNSRYNNRYNNRYGYDRYDRYDRGDRGKFTCDVSRGRVVGIDYSGIRGLR